MRENDPKAWGKAVLLVDVLTLVIIWVSFLFWGTPYPLVDIGIALALTLFLVHFTPLGKYPATWIYRRLQGGKDEQA